MAGATESIDKCLREARAVAMEHMFKGVIVILYKQDLSTNIIVGLSNNEAIGSLEALKHKVIHQMHDFTERVTPEKRPV